MSGVREYDRDALMPEILERLSNGEPLAQICRDEHMPVRAQVYNWLQEDMAFDAAFRKARDDGFDAIAADSLAIVDTPPERVLTENGDKVDSGHVAWLKNRADQRLKLLAKWDPRRYGDKLHTENVNIGMTHEEWLASLK